MRCLVLLLALGLAACGHSPATHFYTLAAVPPQHPLPYAGHGLLVVGNVMLPAMLDRQSVVIRNGPTELDVSDVDRWAAPLQGIIRRVVADDLRGRLGTDHVLSPGDPMPQGPASTVILNIQEFAGDRNGLVTLDTDWSVLDRYQKILILRHVHLTRKVDGHDVGATVAALSDMLGVLCDGIARGVAGTAGV